MSASMPRKEDEQNSSQAATDTNSEHRTSVNHYVGVDVGTGSARACIMNDSGDIVGLAEQNIGLWQPQTGYYEQSTTDIWRQVCSSVRRAIDENSIDPSSVKGIGFDATCSLAVFDQDTDEPVCVTGPDFGGKDGNDRNVILWLDHRPMEETKRINDTNHNLLRYVGGTMSIEMEIPKVLWLKNNMPKEKFESCKFFDLTDALTHLATGKETRSFCSVVCKQGYVPVGVDGSVKGWQQDFLNAIGLPELCEDNFKRMGGVNGNGTYLNAGELVGGLGKKAAEKMGLPAGIAVGSGVIDAYAGWIGTVGAKVEVGQEALAKDRPKSDVSQAFTRLAAVAGTSTCHLAMSENPVFVKGVWGPYRDVLLPDFWMAEGGQSATGELLRHVLETHPAFHEVSKAAQLQNSSIHEHLHLHLREMASKAGAPSISWLGRHLFYYGDLFGNRSPVADPDMRGAVIGLSSDCSIDGLALHYYAALEFIALQTRQIATAMNDSGHSISSIFMSGSQCQNGLLMSLIASACDMPVLIPRYVTAAVVHGAAMLGAKAASTKPDGTSESLWSIMDRMSKAGRAVHPTDDAGEKKLLEAKYSVFLEQCESQQRYRREIDEAIK